MGVPILRIIVFGSLGVPAFWATIYLILQLLVLFWLVESACF